jgi:hypothetical protein
MSTDVSEVRAASFIRAMSELISETSVDIQLRARQYIPEDSELQRRNSFDPLNQGFSTRVPRDVARGSASDSD